MGKPSILYLLGVASSLLVLFGPAFGEPAPASPTAPPAVDRSYSSPSTTTTTTTAPPPAQTDPCASGWCWRKILTAETGAVIEGVAGSPFPIFGGEVICARPATAKEIPASLVDALSGVGKVWLGSGGQGGQYFFRAEANPAPGPVPGAPCPVPTG